MKRKVRQKSRADLTAFFQEMGAAVEHEWREAGYDAARFPEIAAAALERSKASERIDPIDLLREIDGVPLTRQQDVEGSFSNLPITLFSSTRFYIDLYFWLDGTTTIHQHGFAGAFQVLSGSSLHGDYAFRVSRPVNPHFALGNLSLKEVRLLAPGDIRKIIPGRGYIHSLFHLDRPSTTLTVRTIGLPHAQPQFSYLPPGVAIDPFFSDPAIIKRAQTADVLLGMNHANADEIIGEMLAQSDLHTAFALLRIAHAHLLHNESAAIHGLSAKTERWYGLIEITRAKHGDAADVLEAALAESQRQMTVINRRGSATTAELRFFLALLLNIRDRKRIFDLISERYPKESPVETVLDWIEEMSRIKLSFNGTNALGIDEFDDRHLLIIECLVKGKSLSRTQRELRNVYRAEKPEVLNERTRASYDELRHNTLLGPLFKGDRI